MITQKQAELLVYATINQLDPSWADKPEMIITKSEVHDLGWVIYYTSRPYHETGDINYAIAGNGPYLVSKEDGALFSTGSRPPIKERINEAAEDLKRHLQSKLVNG